MSAMNPIQTTTIDPCNRIQLPAEWARDLDLHDLVSMERTENGILIRPGVQATWDDVFATRLTVRRGDAASEPEISEVGGDDFLF